MTNRPRGPQPPASRPLTRRQLAGQQREANLQRRVALAIGGALFLALGLIVAGLVWEQVIQPRRAVKQVENATLTRRDYDQLARSRVIEQIIQALSYIQVFGPNQSFGQGGTFEQQVLQGNFQLADASTAQNRGQPADDTQVEQWVDQQLLEQGARGQYNIDPQQGEVDQLLVGDLGRLVNTPSLSDTGALTDTAALTDTGATTATGATASPAVTPTPLPEQATQQANQVIDTLYNNYTNIINQFAASTAGATAAQRTPHMTKDELANVLRTRYREQLLRTRVGEKLVPSLPAETGDPQYIQLRQILLQVPKPANDQSALPGTEGITDTTGVTDTTGITGTGTLTDTAGITDTSTLPPEQLEQLFVQRKTEADNLYQQLAADPSKFEELARTNSDDAQTAANGGTVGLIDRQGALQQGSAPLPKAVIDAAWALPDNGISQPIRIDTGWVIVQRVPEDPQQKLERLRQEELTKWLDQRRAQAKIVPPPSPSPSPSSDEPTPYATETP